MIQLRLSGWFDKDKMKGKGQLADGTWIDWSAVRTGDIKKKEKEKNDKGKIDVEDSIKEELVKDDDKDKKEKDEELKYPTIEQVMYPFVAYGWTKENQPTAKTALIKNATVWTNEEDGVLEETDVLIKDGKIAKHY